MLSYSDFLLTVDFDRTLTAPDVTIPRANLDAIRRFMALGGSFTLNTGRSIPMFRDYLDTIPHNAPMLLYNGAAWYEGGKLTHCRTIGADWKEMAKEILSVFPELTMEIQGINAHYVFRPNPNWEKFCLAQHSIPAYADGSTDIGPFLKFALYAPFRAATVDALFRPVPEDVAYIDRVADWLDRTYGSLLQVCRSSPRFLDVQAGGVSKAASALDLKARLGKRVLICVGDADNDRSMLEAADFAFCPADGALAGDYPNVCPCAEGAVADVIEKKIPEIIRMGLTGPGSCVKI